MRIFIVFSFVFSLSSSLLSNAYAQSITPDSIGAEEFQRQQERQRLLREQQEARPDVHIERPVVPEISERLPVDETACVMIHSLVLTGELSSRFQWLLRAADKASNQLADTARDARDASDTQWDPATGRCLGAAAINQVMMRMQNALVAQGYVTSRVLAAPQDLSTGVLTLTLMPGRVRQIRFSDDSSPRATQWNAMPARPGDVLNVKDIEQALENFKRVPTAEANIAIVPAEGADAKPGESDVIISWQQRMPFRLNLSADNAGAKSTGKYLGAVTLSYDHWWTLNDLFYISINHDLGGGDFGARGTQGQTVHYSVPFGYWLLGITAGNSRYQQAVAGASATQRYSGESSNQELRLSRLLYRSAARKTTLSMSIWSRSSKNFIDDTEIPIQRRRTAGWEVGLADREYLGRSTLDLSATYRHGTGAMGALTAPEEALGQGSSRPQIVSLSALLNKPFSWGSQSLRYSASWRGQWNDTPLIAQDRFIIGSRYTVRGFEDTNILLGERGWFLRNDLALVKAHTAQELYLGLDYGEVGGAGSNARGGQHLAGVAVGVRGALRQVAFDFVLSRPLSAPQGFDTSTTRFSFSLNASY